MDQFQEIFHHLPVHRVITCRTCQFAVVPAQVITHLTKHHPTVTPAIRRVIKDIVCQLDDIATSKNHVVYPTPWEPPVEGLPVHTDGLRCVACGYVCRTIRGMQEHCKIEHNWANQQRRGGNTRSKQRHATDRLWESNQTCQRFFEYRQWQRYFQVQKGSQSRPSADIQTQKEAIRGTIIRRKREIEEAQKRKAIEDQDCRYVVNPWVQTTGWSKHLAGFDREQMVQSIQPGTDEVENQDQGRDQDQTRSRVTSRPADRGAGSEAEATDIPDFTAEDGDDADQGLFSAIKGTRRLIRHAIQCSKPHVIGRSALFYVNRREAGGKTNEKMFRADQKVATIRKYSEHWVKLLRYIWRTHHRRGRPGYRLTTEQTRFLMQVKRICRGEVEQGGVVVHYPESASTLASQMQTVTVAPTTNQAKRVEDACLDFWMAMLDHNIGSDDYESGIISGLAVMGIDQNSSGWVPAITFTPVMSAIVTIARAMVVYQAYRERERVMSDLQHHQGMTETEASRQAPCVFNGVQRMVQKFMTLTDYNGRPSPMDWILHVRTYGIRIRFTTNAPGKVVWKGDQITIDKASFRMTDLRGMVHGLYEEVKTRLWRDLMMLPVDGNGDIQPDATVRSPELQLDELFDNPAEIQSQGWSFLKDTRNVWSVDGEYWLVDRVVEEDILRSMFIRTAVSGQGDNNHNNNHDHDTPGIQFKDSAIQDYFNKLQKFKEQLLVLVHMSAGAPARGTEITSIQYENGVDNRGYRGVFIQGGMVSFVTSYHKGYSASDGKMKIIHRYVPREVSEIVVYYLWLVQPFVRILQMVGQGQDEFRSFLWEPKPEEQWGDGEDDDDDEDEEVGENEDNRNGDVIPDDHDFEAEVQFHATDEEARREMPPPQPDVEPSNPDGFWDTDRVRRAIQKATQDGMAAKISTSMWREIYPAIHRESAASKEVAATLDSVYQNSSRVGGHGRAEEEGDPRAEQAGHSKEMEEAMYGRLMQQSPFHTMSEMQKFRQVSVDWHRILGFESAWAGGYTDIETKRQMQIRQEQEEFQRWRAMRQTDMRQKLKQVVGEGAEFRGVQEKGLQAIMQRHMRVLIVMRTGGGKSLFFMLPAASSRDGVTVVVVPLTSLREDLMDRCNRVGIKCAEWSSTSPPQWANIVLVTPESVVSKAFARFINEKKMMRQLDRIVIDECHVVLDSTDDWRPQIRQLIEMTEKETQVVYLTATLPPRNEAEFFDAMGLKEGEVVQFRDVTTRMNIEYQVVGYNREQEEEEVERLVREKLQKYDREGGQVVVYCQKVKQVQRLAEVLGCKAFYRQVGTVEEKRQILQGLTSGKERLFVATNALGLGIDAPNIRTVIHVGLRALMREYVQESGRAGRDGGMSEAVVMQAQWTGSDGKLHKEQGWRTSEGMRAFLRGDGCRRVAIDKEMDGRVDRRACEVGERRCDVCQGRPTGTKRRRVRVNNGESEEEVNNGESEEEVNNGESEEEVNSSIGIGIEVQGGHVSNQFHTPDMRVGFDSGLGMSSTNRDSHRWKGSRRRISNDESPDQSPDRSQDQDMGDSRDPTDWPSSPPPPPPPPPPPASVSVSESIPGSGPAWPRWPTQTSAMGLGITVERPSGQAEQETTRLQAEFERERNKEEISRQRRIEEARKEKDIAETLPDRFEDWAGKCAICKARGTDETGHRWEDCKEEGVEIKSMRETVEWIYKRVRRLDDFAGCRRCWAPQSICHSWQVNDSKGQGRMYERKNGGWKCQFGGVMVEAVAALMTYAETDAGMDWLEGERQKRGIVEGEEEEQMARWFRMKVKAGGVEMSEMCRFFNIWG